jgi:hypothetical protein
MKVETSLTNDNYELMELTKYFKEFQVDYDGGCTIFQNSHLDFFLIFFFHQQIISCRFKK